jgi:cyclic pyranopterin phosphate synthase
VLVDGFGRPFRTLRISVTDRCNLACSFCHNEGQGSRVRPATASGGPELPASQLGRIAEVAADLGATQAKLTGGEPLVRTDLTQIVRRVAATGMDVSATTNGLLLGAHAQALAEAGLSRVNVSVDSLDPERFRAIRGGRLVDVLAGVDAAVAAGLTPVKLNMVVTKASRPDVPSLVAYAAARDGVEVQLIQFMPEMAWQQQPAADVGALAAWLGSRADETVVREAHHRRRYLIGEAWVELVDPVGNPEFCMNCHRLRVTADGRLKGCINVNEGAPDLRGLDEQGIRRAFEEAVASRRPYYTEPTPAPSVA